VAQLAVLLIFVLLGVRAAMKFHAEAINARAW
jgi:hypothetical protein